MGTLNFLGLEDTGITPEAADVFIQPIPYDCTTSFQPGARFGPEAVLQASRQVELWDEELHWEPAAHFTPLTLPDVPPNHHGPESMAEDIGSRLQPYREKGKLLLALGGDHSISTPLIQACFKNYPDLVLFYLDAHADLRDTWEGSPLSHACVLRRAAELNLPIFHLGLRSLSREEQEYLDSRVQIKAYSSREILFENGLSRLAEEVKPFSGRNFYLSLDVDALDPSLIPGTGTPEPGGLTWFHTLEALRLICGQGTVRGIDVCELMPLPGSRLSEFVTAKLIFKILSYLFYHRSQKGGSYE